jgi:L-ascorbate metabolism protein UlaG (beta-lactamase superfamily)
MKITYIYHSCFSVETEDAVMLFDYYKGTIPQFDTNKHIFVFASHKHQDHFNMCIFDLVKTYPYITFILSDDIQMNEAYMNRKNIPEISRQHILSIGKNESITLPIRKVSDENPDLLAANGKNLNLLIETLASTDEGVAFIVTLNNKVIYHAGDLNWWSWDGETTEEYTDMTNRFQNELAKIKDRKFDIAFIPLDPRQEDRFWWGFDYFMKTTQTKFAFPMHFWKDYSIISKLKNMEKAKEYNDKIIDIKEEGQIFNL